MEIHECMDIYKKLNELVNQRLTQKEISIKLGISQQYVSVLLKRYGLKTSMTIRREKRNKEKRLRIKPKIPRVSFTYTEFMSKCVNIDFTEITVKQTTTHAKRSTGYYIITVYNDNIKDAYIYNSRPTKSDWEKVLLNYKAETYAGDTALFTTLQELGLYMVSSNKWHCARSPNEKFHGGLKTQIYANLDMIKMQKNLTDYQLLTTHKHLVLDEYIDRLQDLGYKIKIRCNLPTAEELKAEAIAKS